MTVLSRIFGLVRDVIIARIFGATASADAFFVAFKIPNLFRRLVGEGAFSQAFVPVLVEYKAQRGKAEVASLVAATGGTLGLILILVTIAGVLGAPAMIAVFAPGFLDEPDKFSTAVKLLRITFPYLAFISLTAFAGAVLNSYGRFAVPAFTPVLLNLALIACALGLAPYLADPVIALAWGVFVGGAAQLSLQMPFLRRLGLLVKPIVNFSHAGVRRIAKLMAPAIFGTSVAQINLLFDTLLASFLVTGSISWLYYSDRMVEFPLGVFGIALATVILPSLSADHAGGNPPQFRQTLDWALRWVCLIAVPATLGLLLLAEPILATVFQYNAMTAFDVLRAGSSLKAYALGLSGFVLVKVLAPGYFSRQNTRTPVKIGVIAMLANMLMNVALIFPLKHVGLALATSLSAFINAGLLYRGLVKAQIYRPQAGWPVFAARVAGAGVVMALMISLNCPDPAWWVQAGLAPRIAELGKWIGVGALVYFASLTVLGWRPRHMVAARPAV